MSTISCPVTPGGILQTKLSQAINMSKKNNKVQVIEDGGKPIYCGLRVNDPMRPKGCIFKDPNCIVDTKFPCDVTGAVYRIECTNCKQQILDNESTERYIGMTRATVHNRMISHLRDQRLKKSHSPMWRHDKDCHNGETQQYVMSLVAREKKIVRLNCLEALHIERQPPHLSINARQEGGRGGVVRITAARVS